MRPKNRFHSVWLSIARRLQVPTDGSWVFITICSVALFIVGIIAATVIAPEKAIWFPKCPLHLLTGLQCPGCGTARAIHAASRGEWGAAMRYNAIIFLAIPFLVVILIRPSWARRPGVVWGALVVVIIWMIVRNLFRGL